MRTATDRFEAFARTLAERVADGVAAGVAVVGAHVVVGHSRCVAPRARLRRDTAHGRAAIQPTPL